MGDAEKLQEEQRKARAFKSFQDAARNKDTDPQAFEAARMRYYYLSKGPAWLNQEKQKISSEKLDPVIAQYRDMYSSLSNEEDVQRAYTDSIENIRDKQSNIKSSAGKQTSYFQKLAEEEKQKKSAFDRFVELTSPAYALKAEDGIQDAPFVVKYFSSFPSSFKIILDVVLGLFIAIILFLAVSKARHVGTQSLLSRPSSGSINIFQTPSPSSFGSAGH
jgi:hypothetical protein